TRIIGIACLCIFAFVSAPAGSQTAAPQPEWINALRDGGYVIVFRHGATYQDQADTDPLNPSNVAKQRQLNDDGRALQNRLGNRCANSGSLSDSCTAVSSSAQSIPAR